MPPYTVGSYLISLSVADKVLDRFDSAFVTQGIEPSASLGLGKYSTMRFMPHSKVPNLFFKLFYIFFVCLGLLPAYMFLQHMFSEGMVRSSGTEVS